MALSPLLSPVTDALQSSPFTISGAALSSGDITTLFNNWFGSDSFQLTGASSPSSTDSSLVVEGQLATSFLGLTGAQAVATFSVVGSTVEVSIVLSGWQNADWMLSDSLPALAGSFFDLFTYDEPQFTLDSQNQTVLPVDFPAQYGLPLSSAGLGLIPGLSFQALITLGGALGNVAALLSGAPLSSPSASASLQLSGPIELAGELPCVLLSSAPVSPVTLGNFSIAFTLSVLSAPIVTPVVSPPMFVASGLQLEATVTAGSSPPLVIPVYARTFSQGMNVLQIESNLAEASALMSHDISTLIGKDIGGQIPHGFIPLEDIQLESISLTVVPATLQVSSVSAVVTFQPQTGQTWSAFGGLVVFQDLTITFTYLPGVDMLETSVACTALIGSSPPGEVEAGILLPSLYFYCSLDEGSLDISELVKKVTDGTVNIGSVTCTALRFYGYEPQREYQLQATITDDWTFDIPGGSLPLALKQISTNIFYEAASSPSHSHIRGQISGVFSIAGVELFASAEYDGTTGGWIFSGGTEGQQKISIDAVINDALALFGAQLPSDAPQVPLENLNIIFNTATYEFALRGMASVTLAGETFKLGAQIVRDTRGITFDGYLWIGDNEFELDFSAGSSTVVAGSWVASDPSRGLDLNDLIEALKLPFPTLPNALDLTLTKVAIVYDMTGDVLVAIADTARYGALAFVYGGGASGSPPLFGFTLEASDFDLSNLPLVGAELSSAETIQIKELQFSVSVQTLAAAAPALNSLLTGYAAFYPPGLIVPKFPTLPVGATTQILFSATFDYGAGTLPINVPLDGGSVTAAAPGVFGAGSLARGPSAAPTGATGGGQVTSSTTPDGTTWFTVQKSFGPVSIQQIGLLYQSSGQLLWFEVDAALAFGPLTLSLVGLGVGLSLSSFAPSFSLQGLGLSYSNPPLQVSGALVNLAPPGASYFEFEGGVVVGTDELTLAAIGYYSNQLGFSSLFIFGDVAQAFGGPPAFFVTGLALGFGYNSSLTLPTLEQVQSFPFVRMLPGSTTPANLFGQSPTPAAVLQTLTSAQPPWVSAVQGSLWFAAGITFTSFQMVNSQALVVVSAGSELVITLLGTSAAQFPQTGDVTYAYVAMNLEASFVPSQGLFSVQAVLSSSSFVLDPACVLTGGFAFFVWFGDNPHAGDFVLTLGGYNPAFEPPSYYPAVPPVGFEWALDSSISIKGGAYFALTPSMLMAGGELDATYQSGNLQAWFTAYADVLVSWNPFWFDATIGITIGASYKLPLLFTSARISIELGCNLEFWGPPTGGAVTIDWYIISFTVPFGAAQSSSPTANSWSDVQQMLPNTGTPTQPNVLSLTPASGINPAGSSGGGSPPVNPPDDGTPWIVRGGTFGFTTGTPIPISAATFGSTYNFPGSLFNVYPLGWTGVGSSYALTFTDQNHSDWSGAFAATAAQASVPSALWGAPEPGGQMQVPGAADQLVTGQLVGISAQVLQPQLGYTAGPINVAQNLDYDDLALGGAVLPLSASATPTGDVPSQGHNVIALIAHPLDGIASALVSAAREEIFAGLASLQYAPPSDDPLHNFAANVGCALAAEPLLVY